MRIPFNAARRQGVLSHNPAESVELPAKVRGEDEISGSRAVFTPSQVQALMSAAVSREHGKTVFDAGIDWHGAILVAYYTGARLQDVAGLQWKSIDLTAKTITYRAKKTGKLVTIPLHAELELYLQGRVPTDRKTALVFPKLAGKSTGGRSGLSMTFSRIMARAGITGDVLHKRKEGSKGRTVRALTFHSLRHSFNSAMANAGISQEIRMKLTGHLSAEMNNVYTHHELEPLRAAISVIPPLNRTIGNDLDPQSDLNQRLVG